jgi:hypothetical protein
MRRVRGAPRPQDRPDPPPEHTLTLIGRPPVELRGNLPDGTPLREAPAALQEAIFVERLGTMQALAKDGATEALIARSVWKCSPGAFKLLKDRNERVLEALSEGQFHIQKRVNRTLTAIALRGNIQAIKWLEMTRFGVTPRMELTGADGAPLVPADQPIEQMSQGQKVAQLRAMLADGRERMKAKRA